MWLSAEQSAKRHVCSCDFQASSHIIAHIFVWRVHLHLLDVNLLMHHPVLKDSYDTLGAALLQRSNMF